MIQTKLGEGKVFHFREEDFDGNPENTGGSTYVFVEVEKGKWIYSEAHCSNKDNFCRKIGRTIAKGRLEKGYSKVWTDRSDPTWESVYNIWADQGVKKMIKHLHLPEYEVYEYA